MPLIEIDYEQAWKLLEDEYNKLFEHGTFFIADSFEDDRKRTIMNFIVLKHKIQKFLDLACEIDKNFDGI